jgi:hypothetical protein
MSYDLGNYVVDSRRLGSSYLLAAIVLALLFAQCLPRIIAERRRPSHRCDIVGRLLSQR